MSLESRSSDFGDGHHGESIKRIVSFSDLRFHGVLLDGSDPPKFSRTNRRFPLSAPESGS